jgi:hypothetical protein
MPRRTAKSGAGKHFFFEKKKQKTFAKWTSLSPAKPKPKRTKSFLPLFFQKRRPFCRLPWPERATWAVTKFFGFL